MSKPVKLSHWVSPGKCRGLKYYYFDLLSKYATWDVLRNVRANSLRYNRMPYGWSLSPVKAAVKIYVVFGEINE